MAGQLMNLIDIFLVIVTGIVILFIAGIAVYFGRLVIQSEKQGLNLPITDIVGMKMRGVPPKLIIEALGVLKRADITTVSSYELEVLYAAKGDVKYVVETMIKEKEEGKEPEFEEVAARHLEKTAQNTK